MNIWAIISEMWFKRENVTYAVADLNLKKKLGVTLTKNPKENGMWILRYIKF